MIRFLELAINVLTLAVTAVLWVGMARLCRSEQRPRRRTGENVGAVSGYQYYGPMQDPRIIAKPVEPEPEKGPEIDILIQRAE